MSWLPEIDYDRHPAYRDLEPLPAGERQALRNQYEASFVSVMDGIRRYVGGWHKEHGSPDGETWKELGPKGIAASVLPPEMKGQAQDLFGAYLGDRDTPSDTPGQSMFRASAQDFGEGKYPDLVRFLRDFERRFRVRQAVSQYFGSDSAMIFTVHFKRHSENADFYDRPFGDQENIGHAGSGFHIDLMPRVVKVMIYLSDVVEEKDGPFHYVPGSNREEHTMVNYALRKTTNDIVSGSDVEARRRLMALPQSYRQKCYFGADLLPGDPRLGELHEKEKAFFSTDADVLLFDPLGIHRGNRIASPVPRKIMQIGYLAT